MSFCLIILAGGNSHRFRSNVGKPYQKIANKSLIEINVIKALKFKQIKKIIVVYNISPAPPGQTEVAPPHPQSEVAPPQPQS